MSGEVIFGTYFFLADDKVMHEMKRFTFIDLLSRFGGLLSSAIGIIGGTLGVLGYYRRETASKIIQNLFYSGDEIVMSKLNENDNSPTHVGNPNYSDEKSL